MGEAVEERGGHLGVGAVTSCSDLLGRSIAGIGIPDELALNMVGPALL